MKQEVNSARSGIPSTVMWAFYVAMAALVLFLMLSFFWLLQIYNPDATQNYIDTLNADAQKPTVEQAQVVINTTRIVAPIFTILFAIVYLLVARSFKRGNKSGRICAAILTVISTIGLSSGLSFISAWVLLNAVCVALLFTGSSNQYFNLVSQQNSKASKTIS